MLFGPVFTAEIVTSSRRARNAVVRVVYGAVLLLALVMVYSELEAVAAISGQTTVQQYAALAAQYFAAFSILQLLGVTLIAPAITAGTIAGERERRTIEYLFASDLTNWEITFGKLAVALLRGVSFLLVGPPILALAMLMGGIAPARLLAVFAITFSTLLIMIALALTVSVWSPRARQATTRCYFYVCALLFLPPLFYVLSFPGLANYPSWTHWALGPLFAIAHELMKANPFYAIGMVTFRGSLPPGETVWSYVIPAVRDQAIAAAVCIAIAPLAVRRVHLRSLSAGAVKRRWVRVRRPVGAKGMLWKELWAERAANNLGIVGNSVLALVTLFGIGLTIWVYTHALRSSNPADEFSGSRMTISTILECVAVLLVGTRAASVVTSERERDTWTTLLSTPLEGREILLAKWTASLFAARWLLVALVAFWALGLTLDAGVLLALPLLLLSLAVEMAFAASLGTWFSLWCKNSSRALGATVATLIILGGGYIPIGSCCCGWILFFDQSISRTFSSELAIVGLAPCLPFLLGIPNVIPEAVHSPAGDFTEIATAFALGTFGYAIAAAILLYGAISAFDRLSGRLTIADVVRSSNFGPLLEPRDQ